jgi:hypothetical protein
MIDAASRLEAAQASLNLSGPVTQRDIDMATARVAC